MKKKNIIPWVTIALGYVFTAIAAIYTMVANKFDGLTLLLLMVAFCLFELVLWATEEKERQQRRQRQH